MNYLFLDQIMTFFSSQVMSLIVGMIAGVVYWFVLYRRSNKRSFFRTLLIVAIVTAVVYLVADISVLYGIVGGGKFNITVLALAVFHTAELFIFQTHFFDNGYNEFFFTDTYECPLIPLSGEVYAYIFVIAYVLACITSLSLIIRALGRRRAGREWLRKNKNHAGVSHVFFMESEIATLLAEDIKTHFPEQICIMIGYPSPEEGYLDLSLWEKIVRLFKDRNDTTVKPFDAVVYAKIPLNVTKGKDVCGQMNLDDLSQYLESPSCKVYLLSNSEEDNLRSAEQLFEDSCKAEIYCRACREGVNRMYEETLSNTSSKNIRFVDSAYLYVRNIKNHYELHPVNFVDIGIDEQGRKEGWVSSSFNAMILGFGETGREALGFVYEYAAFVGEDKKKSPFTCKVLDRNMDNLELAYLKKAPGMDKQSGISYEKCDIGSNDFWTMLTRAIGELNYIIVCMGDERINLKTAVDIVEYAYRSGKNLSRNFVVLVAMEENSHLDDITLKHYNKIAPYCHCIHPFGRLEEVWTYGNVTNEDLKNDAKHYFSAYLKAEGKDVDGAAEWDKRDQEIVNTDDYATYAKRMRQRSQDYANCFHVFTKLALGGSEIKDYCTDIIRCIPAKYKDKHYTGTDQYVEKVLCYLAIGEHIRWEASHKVLGYTLGVETDDVKKTHDCLKDFALLDNKVKHYDYLVVKTTLSL